MITPVSPELERQTQITARADRIAGRITTDIDAGRMGLLVFASDFQACSELARALIDELGFWDGNDDVAAGMAADEQLSRDATTSVRRTRAGRFYLPIVYNAAAYGNGVALAQFLMNETNEPECLPGRVIIAPESARAALTRHTEPA